MLRPTRFSLVRLTMFDMGPLRGETTIPLVDPAGVPTNLFLIMGPNGAGKTTVLEAIFAAMSILGGRITSSYGNESLDVGTGRVQLDAVVQMDDGAKSAPMLLSILLNSTETLKSWTREELQALDIEAPQVVLSMMRRFPQGPVERHPASHPAAIEFADAVLERLGEHPESLWGTSMVLPTVLYFPSDRGIRRPPSGERGIIRPDALGYAPAHVFGPDGSSWANSIENLLVWYAWLDDDREAICREVVNDLVFRGTKRLKEVNRQALSIPVETETGTHRLDQLSSGERQLVQLVVRIVSHMTGSTIVLIDETEQHLHTVMRRRLLNIFKEWAAEREGLSFIMTSHQAESMRLLAPKLKEPGLHKSGCLVRPKFVPPHD